MVQEILSRLMRTPFGRRIAEDIAESKSVEELRPDAARRLAVARKRIAEEALPLAKKLSDLDIQVATLQAAHDARILAIRTEQHKARCALMSLESAEQSAAGDLYKSAPSVVHDFLSELSDMADVTRRSGRGNTTDQFVDKGHHLERVRICESNEKYVTARIDAIRRAREEIESEVRLELLDDEALANRLGKIRDSIPPVETLNLMVRL